MSGLSLKFRELLFTAAVLLPMSFCAGSGNVQVLVLLPQNYGLNHNFNMDNMELMGWDLTVAGVEDTVAACGGSGGPEITVDTLVTEIDDISGFDVIMIPPSNRWAVPDPYGDLRNSSETLQLIHTADSLDKVIWATCAGVRILAAADVINGLDITGRADFEDEYISAGANFLGENLRPVISGNIVTTTRGQYYNRVVIEAILTALNRRQDYDGTLSAEPISLHTCDVEIPGSLWAKTFGTENSDGFRHVLNCADGSIVMSGYTYRGPFGESDGLLVRTDAAGNILWSSAVGSEGFDYLEESAEDENGDVFFCGRSLNDMFAGKLNGRTGELQWVERFGGELPDQGKSLKLLDNGDLLVLGSSDNGGLGEDDIALWNISPDGSLNWTKYYGGAAAESGDELLRLQNGNFLIVGSTGSLTANRDSYLIRITADGNIEETVNAGQTVGDSGGYDRVNSVWESAGGELLLMGESNRNAPLDAYFLKRNTAGTLYGQTFLGGDWYDYGVAVREAVDGTILMAGNTKEKSCNHNIFLRKLHRTEGELSWQIFGGSASDMMTGMDENAFGDVLICGQTRSFGEGADDALVFALSGLTPRIDSDSETGHAPAEIHFHDASLGLVDHWEWDFNGDGVTDSEEKDPVYTFTEPGEYSVRLRVSNGGGAQQREFPGFIKVFNGESSLKMTRSLITIPAADAFEFKDAFTFESWIMPDSATAGGWIFNKNALIVFLSRVMIPEFTEGQLEFGLMYQTSGGMGTAVCSRIPVEQGIWNHVAVSYDSLNGLNMLINGEVQEIIYFGTPPSGPIKANAGTDLLLGNNAGLNFSYSGRLDEMRIWSKALDPAEISEIMNRKVQSHSESLQYYFPFDEGRGDAVINAADGQQITACIDLDWQAGQLLSTATGLEYSVEEEEFRLSQNYPNPFNPVTHIPYFLPERSDVRICIFDAAGRQVRQWNMPSQEAGRHEMIWDGSDRNSTKLAAGIYFCRLQAGTFTETGKMLLLK